MGMYTELKLHVKLCANTPRDVMDILNWLLGMGEEKPQQMPDHPYFLCERADIVLCGGSSYFEWKQPTLTKLADGWELKAHSSIKNYDSDYEHFLDWIKPYVCDGMLYNNTYATTLYEESETPTVYARE